MSKEMSPEKLQSHIDGAMEEIDALLREWSASADPIFQKRAQLLGYWLRDYTKLLRNEDSFRTKSVPRLKRGAVVSVDFGYRIGREFGGRHFAVVLDKENPLSAPVVTVVPLMSLKNTYKPNPYTCLLDDGLYAPLFDRAASYSETADDLIRETKQMMSSSDTPLEMVRAKLWAANQSNEKAKKIIDEIKHLKAGSVANTCQVTTVSKMRIKRPLQKDDPLYGIRLSTGDMEKINAQLKSLFIWDK